MMFNGVFPAVITPFTESGEVCLSTFRQHLEWLAEQGVHGFVPCATTGESPTVTSAERRELLKITGEVAVKRKLRFIPGCGSNDTATVIRYTKEAAELGAEAALVVTPYYNRPTAGGLIAHYTKVADESPIPVILYNVPSRTAVAMAPETVCRLLEHKNIAGIKEASGSYSQWLNISHHVDLTKKSLLAGDDDAFAAILSLGGTGIISASANVAPAQFVSLYSAASEGRWPEAFQWQKRLFPLVRAMFAETSPAPIKYTLHYLRKYPENVRLPLVPITSATQGLIQSVLNALEMAP